MKPPSPLLGFNNNVRHKGRVFHIQTEDSGVRHPHIITHLFADGGRILKTQKTSYAEYIDAPNMGEVVRQMMQDQHKAMFMALRDGQFDLLVEDVSARAGTVPALRTPDAKSTATPAVDDAPTAEQPPPAAVAAAPAPAVAAPPRAPVIAPAPAVAPPPRAPIVPLAPPLPTSVGDVAQLHVTLPAPPLNVAQPPVSVHVRQASTPRPTPPRMASARPRLDIDPAAIHRAPMRHPTPSGGTLASIVETTEEAPGGIALDTLERAAAEAETPFFQQIHDLPPPPAAVLGARGASGSGGGYSSVTAPSPAQGSPPSTRGRYAPSRPSSIFANVRPQEGSSIFGEDLISEKSLDEVILSYLAEDLDGPAEKK